MRMTGVNIYTKDSQNVDVGSGRFKFQQAAIEYWSEAGFSALWIGLGIELGKDMMKEAVGLRIYAHNGFIDILQFNGIIGLIFYLLILYFLFKYIYSNKNNKYYRLTVSLFLAYFTNMFFQGEHFFLADLIFALGLVLLNNKERNINTHGKN